MAIKTEGTHAGEYIVSESGGNRSRESATLASGDLTAGAVLGLVATASTTEIGGSNVGDGVMGAVTIGADAIAGDYILVCTAEGANVGTFSVTTPAGVALGDLTVASAYTSTHINMTLADGAEDFDTDDTFTITAVVDNYGEFNTAGSNGTETAVAILFDAVDASSAAAGCVITARDSEVNGGQIVFKSGTTAAQETAAAATLADVGIIVR